MSHHVRNKYIYRNISKTFSLCIRIFLGYVFDIFLNWSVAYITLTEMARVEQPKIFLNHHITLDHITTIDDISVSSSESGPNFPTGQDRMVWPLLSHCLHLGTSLLPRIDGIPGM